MMPQGLGGLEDAKHLFIRGWLQRIEAAFTSASEERLPRHLLLDEKNDPDEIRERHYYHVQGD
jgi:hypothetical protein